MEQSTHKFSDKIQEIIDEANKLMAQTKFKCTKGCYECCKINNMGGDIDSFCGDEELKYIKEIVKNLKYEKMGDEYCQYLDKKGKCVIYKNSPVVCKIFGLMPGTPMMCPHFPTQTPANISDKLVLYIHNPKKYESIDIETYRKQRGSTDAINYKSRLDKAHRTRRNSILPSKTSDGENKAVNRKLPKNKERIGS